MVLAIAGGALQGLEAVYLARKAGFETLLLDRKRDAPATGICHRFVLLDLMDHDALSRTLGSVDMVLPATENPQAIGSLVAWCSKNRIPLAFDPDAHSVSSSKLESDGLFRRLGFPAPRPWPHCAFPVLGKPDFGSGSRGVEVFPDPQALERRFGSHVPAGWVLQEYLEGPSFSIEIIGCPGAYTTLQVTDLEMAPNYDCKRVSAPSTLPLELVQELEGMALAVAEELNLSGIMDLEVVLHEGRLKVLEIDARFPSQTPAVVYHSTGINMVERLVGAFFTRNPAVSGRGGNQAIRGAVLEHIRCAQGRLSVGGEGMMADDGPLHLEEDFFGADEALTSHGPERDDWVATLMVTGEDLPAAGKRRDRVVEEVRDRLGLTGYSDEYPDGPLGQAR